MIFLSSISKKVTIQNIFELVGFTQRKVRNGSQCWAEWVGLSQLIYKVKIWFRSERLSKVIRVTLASYVLFRMMKRSNASFSCNLLDVVASYQSIFVALRSYIRLLQP